MSCHYVLQDRLWIHRTNWNLLASQLYFNFPLHLFSAPHSSQFLMWVGRRKQYWSTTVEKTLRGKHSTGLMASEGKSSTAANLNCFHLASLLKKKFLSFAPSFVHVNLFLYFLTLFQSWFLQSQRSTCVFWSYQIYMSARLKDILANIIVLDLSFFIINQELQLNLFRFQNM